VAYPNLGDAYLKLGRREEAKRAFERYLELLPAGRAATYVTEQLRTLQ
jgi:tetratricopeptide (TPR) repeat protein